MLLCPEPAEVCIGSVTRVKHLCFPWARQQAGREASEGDGEKLIPKHRGARSIIRRLKALKRLSRSCLCFPMWGNCMPGLVSLLRYPGKFTPGRLWNQSTISALDEDRMLFFKGCHQSIEFSRSVVKRRSDAHSCSPGNSRAGYGQNAVSVHEDSL